MAAMLSPTPRLRVLLSSNKAVALADSSDGTYNDLVGHSMLGDDLGPLTWQRMS
jgi:hypothetical protein